MFKNIEQTPAPQQDKPKPKSLPVAFNFINAGMSGMAATCVVHPMDVIKNQMQMSLGGVTIGKTVGQIYRSGITNFYAGLSAGLLRQATYTTARLGIYNQLNDRWREANTNTGNPGFETLALMASVAGSVGAFIGTPADVALIRMTSDGRLPPEKRRNYKNVIDAFLRIIKEESVTTLWRGSVATMGRAAIVNISQLATYSQAKMLIAKKNKNANKNHVGSHFVVDVPEGITLHFLASMLSGLITAFNSMPFDIAKTRIQNLASKRKPPNMLIVIFKIIKVEGVRALWKGFWPSYCRIGPHTVLTFIVNEQLAKYYRQIFM